MEATVFFAVAGGFDSREDAIGAASSDFALRGEGGAFCCTVTGAALGGLALGRCSLVFFSPEMIDDIVLGVFDLGGWPFGFFPFDVVERAGLEGFAREG